MNPLHIKNLFGRIQAFVIDTLCKEDVDDALYVGGSTRIEFHASHLRSNRLIPIEEYRPSPGREGTKEFEDALVERLLRMNEFNMLVLLGGLGAGKSTTVQYVLRRLEDRRNTLGDGTRCSNEFCGRAPIYIDLKWLGAKRAERQPTVVPTVFRELRLKLYESLIGEWINQLRISPVEIEKVDPSFLVLRRLLIVNDLLSGHGAEHPTLPDLTDTALTLPRPLFSTQLDTSNLSALIAEHRPAALSYERRLQQFLGQPQNSLDFMILTLRFWLSRCVAANPMNLVVIDNIDQLPTRYVQELLNDLHDVATNVKGLPLLVPLRPSSFNPYGFIRDVTFRYHYGPNSFRVILSRLERHVLCVSRAELASPSSVGSDRPFSTPPADEELDTLLVVTYVYAQIMASGLATSRHDKPLIELHPDHAFLRRLHIGDGALAHLAETCDALVGACCRYGLDLLRRFIDNAYNNPTFLQRTSSVRYGSADADLGPAVRISYSDLVTALLRNPAAGSDSTRVANLFSPARVSRNADWPTLAKLRILSLLTRDKRFPVGSLVQRLNVAGIPTEIVLDSLNSLHDKFRLLLWFSTNSDLTLGDPDVYSHDVVVSEHGERYFRRVVGDFEYLWYCATEMRGRQYPDDRMHFTVKLNDYNALISMIGTTEWKQIAFSRCRSGALPDLSNLGQAAQMEVLNVLYCSLSRALSSTDIAMRSVKDSKRLLDELVALLKSVCDQITFWQQRYEVAFGSNFYLDVYRQPIEELKQAAVGLELASAVAPIRDSLERVHDTWSRPLASDLTLPLSVVSQIPADDLVASGALDRGLIPGIASWLARMDRRREADLFLGRFLQAREVLRSLLERRLPTFHDLMKLVRFVAEDINRIVAILVHDPGELSLYHWCVAEKEFLDKCLSDLRSGAYDVPLEPVLMNDMSRLRRSCNTVMDVAERLARHLAVRDSAHLSVRWQ